MLGEIDLRQTQGLSNRYAELENRFSDAAVRDLLWLLCSPGLLRAGAAQIPQAQPEMQPSTQPVAGAYLRHSLIDLLQLLDTAPARLHARLAAAPQKRLGHYAEQLLAFFLGEGTVGRLIASNLPLRRANQTLGECDFLL